MDNLLMNIPANRATYVNAANPVDAGWNAAVRHIANKCLPAGWDEVEKFEDAPTTLQAVLDYAAKNGRLCVATEDSEGTIFDCADTNAHLRAWHDSLHYRYKIEFNVAGEAAVTYMQAAQVFYLYGINDKSMRWVELLLADILGLVLFHKKTGKYPKNKRNGCLNEAKQWKSAAREIADNLPIGADGSYYETAALSLAAKIWGNP